MLWLEVGSSGPESKNPSQDFCPLLQTLDLDYPLLDVALQVVVSVQQKINIKSTVLPNRNIEPTLTNLLL